MSLQITPFDDSTTRVITTMMQQQHVRLAQLDLPRSRRSTTALNYDSAIKALGDYLVRTGSVLPTKGVLTQWRDDMLAGRADESGTTYAIRSVNARMAAARKLLRAVADDVTDISVKLVLNDWAKVEDAKASVIQDKTESDYVFSRLKMKNGRESFRSSARICRINRCLLQGQQLGCYTVTGVTIGCCKFM
jgi:hypothetical protein